MSDTDNTGKDETFSQNQNAPDVEPSTATVGELQTLTDDDTPDGHGPTGNDTRPDGFVPGDQTAAGALTPPGAQHPAGEAGIPGVGGNLLDPYNVNGVQRNQELIAAGEGIENPAIDQTPHPVQDDD